MILVNESPKMLMAKGCDSTSSMMALANSRTLLLHPETLPFQVSGHSLAASM
jgi:hypothetical protein